MSQIYNESLPSGYSFAPRDHIKPEEIISLRESVGWLGDSPERWSIALEQSLDVIAVRSRTGDLVGMVCLAGNARHAVMCDLVVHPDHQHQGIGEALMAKLEQSLQTFDVTYVYAELAKTNPFREKMIQSGFVMTRESLFRAR